MNNEFDKNYRITTFSRCFSCKHCYAICDNGDIVCRLIEPSYCISIPDKCSLYERYDKSIDLSQCDKKLDLHLTAKRRKMDDRILIELTKHQCEIIIDGLVESKDKYLSLAPVETFKERLDVAFELSLIDYLIGKIGEKMK